MKILITSGPTREPIDGARFITNLSTGETGRRLAEHFARAGFEVTFFRGGDSARPDGAEKCIPFGTFQDLNGKLQELLREETFDMIVHAAAVGDYAVDRVRAGDRIYSAGVTGKIDSAETVEISLRRNFKILDRLKSYCGGRAPLVVGFKLTNSKNKEDWWNAVKRLYEGGQVDLVVHNDLSERSAETGPKFRLVRQNGAVVECENRDALARALEDLLRRKS